MSTEFGEILSCGGETVSVLRTNIAGEGSGKHRLAFQLSQRNDRAVSIIKLDYNGVLLLKEKVDRFLEESNK